MRYGTRRNALLDGGEFGAAERRGDAVWVVDLGTQPGQM
jgi:hypothetical protein